MRFGECISRSLTVTFRLLWGNGEAWSGIKRSAANAAPTDFDLERRILISLSRFESEGVSLTCGKLKRMEKGKAKRWLVFVEDLSEQVKNLERDKENLTSEAGELRSVLKELVEACEAGGTSRYMESLGRARRLLDRLDAAEDDTGD